MTGFSDRLNSTLRELKARGKPARKVAEDAGITPGALSLLRHGKRAAKAATIGRLADACGVTHAYLGMGQGHKRLNVWSVRNRALYEVDGIENGWGGPIFGWEMERVEDEFYRGFQKQFGQHQYAALSPTVHVIFGNLLARAMKSYRNLGEERVSDPEWRGKIAGRLLVRCEVLAREVHPSADFDMKPWSTRAWIAAMANEMERWEGDRQTPSDFNKED